VFPEPATVGEWEEQIRANIERGWPADWIERKYTPPDWNKVYPLLGGPPVWSTENIDAYTELLNGFTEMLEPRDIIELTDTKRAADATWEAARLAREKNSLPEQKYQQRLRVLAQLPSRTADDAAKPATAFDHSLGLQAGCKYYQAFDIAESRAIKRCDNALRQIARWREGLGAKARRLSDKFIAEQALVERYGATELLADAETDTIASDSVQAAPPLASTSDAADAAPPVPLADEAPEAAPSLACAAECLEAAPPLRTSDETAAKEIGTQLFTDTETEPIADDAVQAAFPLASVGEAADAALPVPPAGEAAGDAPAPTGEGADAAPQGAPPDEAAQAAPPNAPAGEIGLDIDSLSERINWVGWLTGAEKYEWIVLSKGAQKEFKQSATSKRWLVEKLVMDRKVIRPDQVCPELAHYLPAIAQAAPTVAASAEAPQ
jgi:hypothetical protein